MSFRSAVSTAFHRYLNIPYTLHTHEFRSPKKPIATYVFIHGIGNTLHSWDEVAAAMPKNVRLIGVDLLGFGKSPRPTWAAYNARMQARSVGLTLLGMRLSQKPIIVGHSLGALVSVEIAKRYPLLPRRLVLCSPPFYKPEAVKKKMIAAPDDILRTLYRVAKKHPEELAQLSPFAVKVGLANKALNITSDNIGSYMAALEASIINQTSLRDVARVKLPVDIFYGVLDPVVIGKNIVTLAKTNGNVSAHRIMSGHEVVGKYGKSLASFLSSLPPKKPR